MENTYYVNSVANSNIDAIYDKLFSRFEFIHSKEQADILVIPGEFHDDDDEVENTTEKEENKAKIFLTQPKKKILEIFSDEKGNDVYVSYSNNLSVSQEIVFFLNSKGLYSKDNGNLQIVSHISDLVNIKENSFFEKILKYLSRIMNSEEKLSFEDFIAYLLEMITEEAGLSK